MKKILVFCTAFFIFQVSFVSLASEEFKFSYRTGDSYKILSTVNEDVFLNDKFHHSAVILNRISVDITGVENDWGVHKATFMTTETSTAANTQKLFTWGEEYPSVFKRSPLGEYEISDIYFMPVVRNVPIFPDRDIKIGETWTSTGEEAHDMRQVFNLQKPFKIPFTVQYTYEGPVTKDGKTLHKITAKYNLFHENKMKPVDKNSDYPAITIGYSNQNLYWNLETGTLERYDEEFRIRIETAFGSIIDYVGTANAEQTQLIKQKNAEAVANLQEQLKDLGVENTTVTATDEGITISMEQIQFMAESAVLLDSEKIKIQKIAQLLKAYPDNDLLVAGHTALAGTAQGRKDLSEKRAVSVASYLMELGVKDAKHIFTQGFGAEKPIADNKTKEGMARNRRVEITIMDK